MTIKEFSVFGSCNSRMIFNESFAPGYKKTAHINFSVEGVSLISLMSQPVPFDSKLLTHPQPYSNECVSNDFTKNYLTFIKSNNLDYIVMDTYFDVEVFNVMLLDNGSYITDSARLRNTELYNTLNIKKRINIHNNFNEFFDLWKKSCDSFFKFIEENCENTKVILNPTRFCYKYKTQTNDIAIEPNFKKRTWKHNYARDILEQYLLNNYEVDLLLFDENTLLDKNHVYGFEPSHFLPEFYPEKLNQVNEIIALNDSDNPLADYVRKLKKENQLLKISKNIDRYNQKEFKYDHMLNKYRTARIDLINKRYESNSIEVTSFSDERASIDFPDWFKTNEGKGVIIQSTDNPLTFEIKCINDGILNIYLRGIDFLDKNDNRFPVFIDYKKVLINNEDYLHNSKLVCHDKPHIIKKEVKDSEIITIHIEWAPFSSDSTYII